MAVIIDCLSHTYNCFIAGNWLNVVTDLIGSSYLRFTYSIPGLSLGHLSFFLQMIWWHVQPFKFSPAGRWYGLSSLLPQARKETKIGGKAFITALQGGSVWESGREVSRSCMALTLEVALVGSPVPPWCLEWRLVIIIILVASPAFRPPALHLLKPPAFPLSSRDRKKVEAFYRLRTAPDA